MAALRDHLEESRAERGQLDHYRSISRELEGAKARVEEELLATAQLVTKLEARLREAHAKVGAVSVPVYSRHRVVLCASAQSTAELAQLVA